jgi:hypothetical protein
VTHAPTARLSTLVALALVLVVLVGGAACGRNGEDVGAGDGRTTTTTTTAATTTTATPPSEDELPGERVEIFPHEGAQLAVVGVAVGDTLNVREGPGVDFGVAFELEPLAVGITATGHNRHLDESMWAEITAQGRTGWANTTYLLQPGAVDDITSQIAEDRPRAETMRALGRVVAERVASDDPPSTIVVVDGPTVGDLAEITVDVIGFGDDSVGGERLHIFAEPAEGGTGFVLRTVERTVLCSRGVADETCV